MNNRFKIVLLSFFAFAFIQDAEAWYVFKNGCLVNTDYLVTRPVHEHFNIGVKDFNHGRWTAASKQFNIVSYNYPYTALGQDAYFLKGVCLFNMNELDQANDAFSEYIKLQSSPQYFEDAIGYKFLIAEKFRCGTKRRVFGYRKMPKWLSGKPMALKIYDEILITLPRNEYASQSAYSKGILLWEDYDYRGAIEAFQMLIRRYPKHVLAPCSYLNISRIYLAQSRLEFQNPDILPLAQLNLKRFQQEFPRDERISDVEEDILKIKEQFACGLFETGRFFERTGHPESAIIYYLKTIKLFPDTGVAEFCRASLDRLEYIPRHEAVESFEQTVGTEDAARLCNEEEPDSPEAEELDQEEP